MVQPPLTPPAPAAVGSRPAPGRGRAPWTDYLGLPVMAAVQWVAWGDRPPAGGLLWTWLAVAGALAAAACTNRLVDVPAGSRRAQLGQAAGGVAGACALLTAARQLPGMALELAPLAVLGMVVYPSLRRHSAAHPVAWGALQALGPLWAWIAARGSPEGPAWLFGGASGLWLAGSAVWNELRQQPPAGGPPQRLPAAGTERALWAAAGAHLAAVALWVMAGWAAGRDGWYFAGVAAAAALLGVRHRQATRHPAHRIPASPGRVDAAVALAVGTGMMVDVLA